MIKTSTAALFAPVQADLATVEARLREAIAGQNPTLTATTTRLVNAGGKRIRPALCLLSAGIFDADREKSISLAAAVEMLHTATLVHDDLIDNSPLRRGAPTLNADWSPNAVVLTGDYLFARAAYLGAWTNNVQVMTLFSQTLMTIVNGEIEQMFSSKPVSRDNYYERIYAKTAAMFVLATEAAATLGGADEVKLDAVRTYGRNIGMAYQIVDDVLDLSGDPKQMGKPAGNDLHQGVITLPTIHYIETHPQDLDVQRFLDGQIDKRDIISRLVAAIRQSDAIHQTMQEARELATCAQLALEKLPDSAYTATLHALADHIVNRNF
jgi:geranylgeranyl pyrophosphate synthase